MPLHVRDLVRAAFEHKASVRTPERCRDVWRDQMMFFAVDPPGASLRRSRAARLWWSSTGRVPFAEAPERRWLPLVRVARTDLSV